MPHKNLKEHQWKKSSVNGEDHWSIESKEPFLVLRVFPGEDFQISKEASWEWSIQTEPDCSDPVMFGHLCSSSKRAKLECLESLPHIQREMGDLIRNIQIANSKDSGNKVQIIKYMSGLRSVPDVLKVCEIGDILYGRKYICKIDMENLFDQVWLPLSVYGLHPVTWGNLSRFGIEKEPFISDVTYTCPFTKNKFFWFYPSFIVTDVPMRYWVGKFEDKEYRERSFVFNDEWIKDTREIRRDGPVNLSPIGKSLMGHGYTEGTYPHDGHGKMCGLRRMYFNLP